MSSFISRIHKYIRDSRAMRRGATARPDDARRGRHKEYPRMPRVALPRPLPTGVTLEDTLKNRSSFRQALSDRPFTASELGTLLGLALGARAEFWSRNYPSGGALFPIETYLIGEVLQGYGRGVFHYHPTAHALEHLWSLPKDFSMSKVVRTPVTPLSSTLVIFTAVWERSSKKYGDHSYSHGMLEAGHMAQNLLLTATAIGTQSHPVAGCEDSYVAELLDIDGEAEQLVYGVLLSPAKEYPQRT